MTSADEILNQQRQVWDGASVGWERWEPIVQDMIRPVGTEMISQLGVDESTAHLDAAAGTGQPGLTIAQIATRGRVVLTDLSPGMIETEKRAIAALGLDNVEVCEASADSLPYPDETFDTVGCRFGLMFVPNVAATVNELARVVKPGGRMCVAVWAEPPKNPWVTVPLGVISTEVELPTPPPDAPSMFRCAQPGAMASLFEAAGLHDVNESEVPITTGYPSFDQYWEMTNEVSAPIVMAMNQLDQAGRDRVKAKMREALASNTGSDGVVRLGGVARVIVGTK